ncbi:MAG: CapA family protein [Oscillospiraceae bacterium]|nr:CapA family protein [Oscillospiraceae bacterium]
MAKLYKLLAFSIAVCITLCFGGCVKINVDKQTDIVTEDISSDTLPSSEVTTTTEATTSATTTEATTTVTTTTEATTTAEPEPEFVSVRIVCAGDNLIHRSIYNQAKRRADKNDIDGYDFSYVYERVESYIKSADLAILNQETIVTDEFEPSDYPRFCTPADLGSHMIEIGFDAFSLSNNHVLDKDEAGLLSTLNFWDSQENIIRYGAYKDKEDMENIRTMVVNGITFAFLGYMEHTNGLSLADDAVAEITYLRETELIEAQIRKADEIADVVIVSPHFGTEISNELKTNQINMAKMMIEWGADIVIGTQAHTVQTMEFIEREDGSRGFVYYCLGNFVSAQADPKALVGILGDLTVTKNLETNEINIENVKAIPIITQYGYNYSNIHIVPYAEYTQEMLEKHGADGFTKESIDKVLSYIPEEYLSVE